MLLELHVRNLALIERADVEFGEGLNILTGETGSGKSIFMGSVNMALGGKVPRDIRELKLSKVQTESGKQRYVVLQNQDGLNDKYIRVLRDSFMSMDMAQNILVIKTVEGMAMAAGVALDAIHFHEIVGCVAGDNTIFCAVRSVDDTIILMDKLKKLLAG